MKGTLLNRIGIRTEDKNRWERRAPLVPDHVRELVGAQGLDVAIQPSPRRAFSDQDYVDAGAATAPNLEGCRVILGVKEIPPEKLESGRVYVIFPHVLKGQALTRPMLTRMADLGCTLIDYERIVDRKGRRLTFFGRHAGYAGMLDSLWALGQRLAAEGFFTPIEHVRLAHQYASLEEALHHLTRVGEHIRHVGLPVGLRPIVTAFTGSGNVARGAQEVYDRLPALDIDPHDLPRLTEDRDQPRNAVFRTVLRRADRYRRCDGGDFDDAEFLAHPERYESALDVLLPHITLLVNGAYWRPGQPELVSRQLLGQLLAAEAQPKLRVIGDITCDVGGGIAATVRPTDPGDPVYLYHPETGARPGVTGPGFVVMAVDNLPCELPVDASQHFGDSLVRFVGALARCDWDVPWERLGLPRELRDAVLLHQGEPTPPYAILHRYLTAARR
jgi:alpha-aminoadipic semialdehyde synthase